MKEPWEIPQDLSDEVIDAIERAAEAVISDWLIQGYDLHKKEGEAKGIPHAIEFVYRDDGSWRGWVNFWREVEGGDPAELHQLRLRDLVEDIAYGRLTTRRIRAASENEDGDNAE